MDLGLEGKVALVAASSVGLGFATARQLALEGAKVIISGRRPEQLESAVDRIRQEIGDPGCAYGLVADVTVTEDVPALIEMALNSYGRLDILITNAGGPPSGAFEQIDDTTWARATELTLLSAVRLIRAALPHLRQSDAASILTITSISAKQPIDQLMLSNVLRPAVIGLTKTLSQELGPAGIRVNSILPGWTRTERVEQLLEYRARTNSTSMELETAKVTAEAPLGRMAEPEEIGRVATFLVSPAASYITGMMLQVDGGRYKGLF